jgi:hypothetical protein
MIENINRKKTQYDFGEVVSHFHFEGKFCGVDSNNYGHINDTFVVYLENGNQYNCRYILQRINTDVFRTPRQLMRNVKLVTEHLREKIRQEGGNVNRETLTLVPTTDGDVLYISPRGDFWRAYIFIEGAQTYMVAENLEHVYNAGMAFGKFQYHLSDFPIAELHETIPDFHNTRKRFNAFVDALDKDTHNRAIEVKQEINFVLARSEEMGILVDAYEGDKLPGRVTHNDTKFNNVMIDDYTGEGVCVIDLDTVMPGLSLYDYGDAIRSIANTGEEDERDLSKVRFSLDTYKEFSNGFLRAVNGNLVGEELALMPFSAKLMTLECGMRFLTDHLKGDVYFRIHRQNHNLDRARTQFKLVREMERQMGVMENIIMDFGAGCN